MAKFKSALLATLIVASPLVASPAFALTGYNVFKSGAWTGTGSTTLTGATTATVAGIPIPCTANFTLSVSGGTASVTAASFSGSSACAGVTAQNLPWPVSAPTAASGSSVTLTISGVNVKFSSPSATCTGSASGTLTNANPNGGGVNDFTFTAPLSAPCTNVKSNPKLTSADPIKAI